MLLQCWMPKCHIMRYMHLKVSPAGCSGCFSWFCTLCFTAFFFVFFSRVFPVTLMRARLPYMGMLAHAHSAVPAPWMQFLDNNQFKAMRTAHPVHAPNEVFRLPLNMHSRVLSARSAYKLRIAVMSVILKSLGSRKVLQIENLLD